MKKYKYLELGKSFNVVDKEHHTIKIKIPRKTRSDHIRTYPDANQNSFNSGPIFLLKRRPLLILLEGFLVMLMIGLT